MHTEHHAMHLCDLDRWDRARNHRRAETGRMAVDVKPRSFEDRLCRSRRSTLTSPI